MSFDYVSLDPEYCNSGARGQLINRGAEQPVQGSFDDGNRPGDDSGQDRLQRGDVEYASHKGCRVRLEG